MIVSIPNLDLEKIAKSGQCFRWERTDDGCFRIPHGAACLYIRQEGSRFFLDCGQAEFEAVWKPYFDLATDYAAINGRIRREEDPCLCQALRSQRGVRILRQDAWEMLITSIITQNRNIPAIRRSVEALCRLAGEARSDRRGLAYHTFPTPAQLAAMSAEALAECRLGYRERYVRLAAEEAASGRLNVAELASLPDEAARQRLLRLCGVGEKVAACILLFGLHRLNAFPRDVWINRALEAYYPQGFPFDRYAPYCGVYQQYLFAWIRSAGGGKTAY